MTSAVERGRVAGRCAGCCYWRGAERSVTMRDEKAVE